ncbi:MAG: hypothetical protein KDN22_28470 [Verrucomicrobiae bacterium]|nr:hypothetical protein [Verrucomicrobiae bacterium]
MIAFLSRDGVLLPNPEKLVIDYHVRDDHEDGVQFLSCSTVEGESRFLDEYHLPTMLHAFRRYLHDLDSEERD